MPPPGASTNASQSPFGDQATLETGSSSAVAGVGQPPAVATVQTCGKPLRFEMKASRVPSGAKLGNAHTPIFVISATDAWSASGASAVSAAGSLTWDSPSWADR